LDFSLQSSVFSLQSSVFRWNWWMQTPSSSSTMRLVTRTRWPPQASPSWQPCPPHSIPSKTRSALCLLTHLCLCLCLCLCLWPLSCLFMHTPLHAQKMSVMKEMENLLSLLLSKGFLFLFLLKWPFFFGVDFSITSWQRRRRSWNHRLNMTPGMWF